jgi:hypothetical protein
MNELTALKTKTVRRDERVGPGDNLVCLPDLVILKKNNVEVIKSEVFID